MKKKKNRWGFDLEDEDWGDTKRKEKGKKC